MTTFKDPMNDRAKRETALREMLGDEKYERNRERLENAEAVREAARFVRQMREHAKLTQGQLAEKLGVTQPRISEIERGNTPDGIGYALLRRVAKACGFEDWPVAPVESIAAEGLPPVSRTSALFESEPLNRDLEGLRPVFATSVVNHDEYLKAMIDATKKLSAMKDAYLLDLAAVGTKIRPAIAPLALHTTVVDFASKISNIDADTAMIIAPTEGALAGDSFLVVDADGITVGIQKSEVPEEVAKLLRESAVHAQAKSSGR